MERKTAESLYQAVLRKFYFPEREILLEYAPARQGDREIGWFLAGADCFLDFHRWR